MRSTMISAVLTLLPSSCEGQTCSAGMKTIGRFCLKDTASCGTSASCCEADTTKCGGAATVCLAGFYRDPAKAGTAVSATPKTMCCIAKATCTATPTCPDGYKKKAGVADGEKCTTDSASCPTTCCEKDTTKCGGADTVCLDGFYRDPAKAGTAVGTTPKTTCCIAKATCTAPGGGTTAAGGTTGGTTGAGDASDGQAVKPSGMGLLLAAAGAMTYLK